jgi:phosphate uptake regulator
MDKEAAAEVLTLDDAVDEIHRNAYLGIQRRIKESPENLDEDLVEITDILITVRDHQQNILSSCQATLSGKAIDWSNMGGS